MRYAALILLVACLGPVCEAADSWPAHELIAERMPWMVWHYRQQGDDLAVRTSGDAMQVANLDRIPADGHYPRPDGPGVDLGGRKLSLVDRTAAETGKGAYRVVAWTVPLPADGRWMVRCSDQSLRRITLDGRELVPDGRDGWFPLGESDPCLDLAAGEHRVMAIERYDGGDRSGHVVLIRDPGTEVLAGFMDADIAGREGKDRLGRLRWLTTSYTKGGGPWDPVLLTQIDDYLAELRRLGLDTDPEEQRHLFDFLRSIMVHGPAGEDSRRGAILADHLPRKLWIDLAACEKVDLDLLRAQVSTFLAADRPDIAEAMFDAAVETGRFEPKELWRHMVWNVRWSIHHSGHLRLARKWMAQGMEHVVGRRRESDIARDGLRDIQFMIQSRSGLVTDPAAAQAHHELGILLERGDARDRTVDAMLDIMVRGAGSLRDDGDRVIDQALESRLRVAAHPELARKLERAAAVRLARFAEAAIRRRDLQRIQDLIERYGMYTDVAHLHQIALEILMDQRDDVAARRHALALIEHHDQAVRERGYAHLVVLEGVLGLGPEERTPLPEAMARATCTVGGAETTIRELAERHGYARPEPGASGIGRVIATLPGPANLPRAAWEHPRHEEDLRATQFWSRPAATGDLVVYADPGGLLACDRDDGSIRWQVNSDNGTGLDDSRRPKRFGVCTTAGVIIHLHNGGDLVGFDRDGRRLWSLSDDPGREGWQPWTVPVAAEGSTWLLLRRHLARSAPEIAVARLDPRRGTVRDIQILMQIGARQDDSTARWEQRFCANDRGMVFGSTGLGSVMRLDPLTGRVLWHSRLPAMHQIVTHAATWIGADDRSVVAYCPNQAQWVAFDAQDGALLWRRHDPRVEAFHAANGEPIVLSRPNGPGSTIQRLDPETGDQRWVFDLRGGLVTGEGCQRDGKVFVPTDRGLLVLDLATGERLDRIEIGPATILTVTHHGDRCSLVGEGAWYLCDTEGRTDASGRVAWQWPEPVTGQERPDLRRGFAVTSAFRNPFSHEEDMDQWYHRRVMDWTSSRMLLADRHRVFGLDLGGVQDGVRRKPRMLWQRDYPNLTVSKDGACGWSHRRLEVLGTEGVIWSYRPPHADGRSKAYDTRISRVRFESDRVFVQLHSRDVIALRRSDGEEIGGCRIPGGWDLWLVQDDLLIVEKDHQRLIKAFDLATGEERWSHDDLPKKVPHSKVGHRLLYWNEGKAVAVDLTDGSIQRHKMPKVGHGRMTLGSKVVFGNGTIFDTATGKSVKHDRAVLDYLGDVAFAIDGEGGKTQVTFVHRDGATTLDEDRFPGHWRGRFHKHSQGRHMSLRGCHDGTHGYFSYGSGMWQFDLATGAIQAWHAHGYDERGVLAVPGGFLVLDRWWLRYAVTDSAPMETRPQLATRVSDPDGDGWPRRGWAKPRRLGQEEWQAEGRSGPRAAYGTQTGYDEDHVYFRLVRGPTRGAEVTNHLAVYASENADGKRLAIHWDTEGRDRPRLSGGLQRQARSWRRVLPDGRADFRVAIAKSSLGLDGNDAPPKVSWLVEEHVDGKPSGRFLRGQLPVDGHDLRRREGVQVQVGHIDDREARAAGFAVSGGFMPQGRSLAWWLWRRRLLDPRVDNEALLRDMLQRGSQHASAANVLACWYLERVRAIAEGYDPMMIGDVAFNAACDRAAEEIAAIARKMEVPEEIITVGLARVEGMIGEISLHAQHLALPDHSHLKSDKHGIIGVRFGEGDPCLFGGVGRYWMCMPLGLYAGELQPHFNRLTFDRSWHVMLMVNWHVKVPGREDIPFVDAEGAANEVLTYSDHTRHSTMGTPLGDGLVVWSHRHKYAAIGFPKQPLPDLSQWSELSPESLLSAIDTMPSNSDEGQRLISAYRKAVGDGEALPIEDLVVRVLRRIGSNGWRTYHFLERIRGSLPEGDRIALMDDLLERADASRHVRRWSMHQFTEVVRRGRTRHLGPWPAELPMPTRPEEVPDPLGVEYVVGPEEEQQTYTFASFKNPDRDPYDIRELKGQQRMYHLADLVLQRDDKVYLFLANDRRRMEETEVTVWVDGRMELEPSPIRHRSGRIYAIPLRLEAGRHRVLIGETFHRHWGLRVSVGDTDGAPIEGVVLSAPEPRNATSTRVEE